MTGAIFAVFFSLLLTSLSHDLLQLLMLVSLDVSYETKSSGHDRFSSTVMLVHCRLIFFEVIVDMGSLVPLVSGISFFMEGIHITYALNWFSLPSCQLWLCTIVSFVQFITTFQILQAMISGLVFLPPESRRILSIMMM